MNNQIKGQLKEELAHENTIDEKTNINSEGKPQFDLEIQRLAALSTAEYERERKSVSKKLDVRLSTIDAAVKTHKEKGCDDAGQSLPEYVRGAEPWHEAVNGCALADSIYHELKRYLGASDAIIRVLTIWVIGTYCYQAFNTFPYLYFSSPEPGCGKTTALKLLRAFSYRSILASSLTPAVVYRLVDKYSPTLLIDEFDTYSEINDALQGILNSGHEKLGCAWRCNEAKNNDVEPYHTYCPKALAGIGDNRKRALASRCITIQLKKLLPSEAVEEMPDDFYEESEKIRRQCIRWASDTSINMDVPIPYTNRTKDNWKALLCIAVAVSTKWYEYINSAISILKSSTNNSECVSTRLLSDIRDIFHDQSENKAFITSKELCDKLNALDESEWKSLSYGKGMQPRELAKLLNPYGIASRQKKLDSQSGYDLALMLDKAEKLKNNTLYLGLHNDVLQYTCIDPDGKYQENTITWQELHENGAAVELKSENGQLLQQFEAINTAILKVTSKRGHTRQSKTNLRCYFYNDFQDVFKRYLPKTAEKSATAATRATSANIVLSEQLGQASVDATKSYLDKKPASVGNSVADNVLQVADKSSESSLEKYYENNKVAPVAEVAPHLTGAETTQEVAYASHDE